MVTEVLTLVAITTNAADLSATYGKTHTQVKLVFYRFEIISFVQSLNF